MSGNPGRRLVSLSKGSGDSVEWRRLRLLEPGQAMEPDDQPAHLQPQRHRPEARFGFPTAGRVPEAAEYENNNLPEFGGDTRQRSLTWGEGSRGGQGSGGSRGGQSRGGQSSRGSVSN